jgi:RNA polymerase sigma factor (sigma-70 family)
MIELKQSSRRPTVLSDEELARAAQNGDATSLGFLLEQHRAPLYALASHIFGHGAQAPDAVQDTFLIALSNFDRLRDPAAVGGWLRGITRNVCLMQLRAERQVYAGDFDAYLERGISEPSIEETIDRLALREWVWTALSELPETLRVTAILRYFSSYPSYEEISAIMGVPVGTVGSRLSQVKIKLAEALLRTAELEHDGARLKSATLTRYVTEVFEECNRGQFQALTRFLSKEAVAVSPGMAVLRGRESVVKDLMSRMEEDVQDGVRLRLSNVIASKDMIVIESAFENPPDDPFHCPPSMVEVHLLRGDMTSTLRRYYAPRPNEDTQKPESQR